MKAKFACIDFPYLLGCAALLEVKATIYWGNPAQLNGAPEDCYPAEDTTIEITRCSLNGNDFEYDDIYIGSGKKQEWLGELLENAAMMEFQK